MLSKIRTFENAISSLCDYTSTQGCPPESLHLLFKSVDSSRSLTLLHHFQASRSSAKEMRVHCTHATWAVKHGHDKTFMYHFNHKSHPISCLLTPHHAKPVRSKVLLVLPPFVFWSFSSRPADELIPCGPAPYKLYMASWVLCDNKGTKKKKIAKQRHDDPRVLSPK